MFLCLPLFSNYSFPRGEWREESKWECSLEQERAGLEGWDRKARIEGWERAKQDKSGELIASCKPFIY